MAEDDRSLIDLPRVNLEGVLTKLPLPSLHVCCCVSKSLLNLIKNDSDFARLHLANSEPQLMIQSNIYETIHLIDLDTDTTSRVEVKPNFNIPLRGLFQIRITDSCNGLLLLESVVPMGNANNTRRCIVYNPVTGESTMLPEIANVYRHFASALFYCPEGNRFQVLCAYLPVSTDLDASSTSFKEVLCAYLPVSTHSGPDVIDISDSDSDSNSVSAPELIVISDSDTDSDDPRVGSDTDPNKESNSSDNNAIGEIFVVGSNSWKLLGKLPFCALNICSRCHLEKTVHWICTDQAVENVIVFFNFESHKFGEIPGPTHVGNNDASGRHNVFLVALKNRLSLFDYFTSKTEISVWVMKEYGVKESWSKDFVIDTTVWDVIGIDRWVRPFMCRNNGEVVMISGHGYILFYDLLKKKGRTVGHPPLQFLHSVVVHTPSFISLGDVVRGSSLEVINVTPRVAATAGPILGEYNYLEPAKTFIELF